MRSFLGRDLKIGNYQFAVMSSCGTISSLLTMVAIEVFTYMLYSPQFPANTIAIGNLASSTRRMKNLLITTLIGTPLVATYTNFVLWTFKGKVKLNEISC